MFKISTLFLLAIFSVQSRAVKVDLSGQGITDDHIAESIKNHSTWSVSEAIKYVEKNYNLDDVTALNFRNNIIGFTGAYQILKFANGLPKLEILNFSVNSIYEESDSKEFDDICIEILKKENFKTFDISVNGIASSTWRKRIISKIDNDISIDICKKIKIIDDE